MTSTTENLILQTLKKIQADQGAVRRDLRERLSSIEVHLAASSVESARVSSVLDLHDERLLRIENQLECGDN